MYDVAIIGGGPAGLSAALYAGRAGLSCILFEKLFFGGQMLKTAEIDNYPGAPEIRDVYAFSASMHAQAAEFGGEFKNEAVSAVRIEGNTKIVTTTKGEYHAKTLVLATGAYPKKLEVPGEAEFSGKGVSYCATCDGAFFKGKTVAVVGGGDTALEDALFLSAICEKVYLIHRRDTFRGAHHLYIRAKEQENIVFILDSAVTEIKGNSVVEEVEVMHLKNEEKQCVKTDAVFIAIGTTPDSKLFSSLVTLDKNGYVTTDETLQTSADGVFAAGDVRQKALRQIITATSDGAEAIYSIQRYLLEQ